MNQGLTELDWIKAISDTWGRASTRVEIGIGDDAAVVESPTGKLVVTVDSLVEGVHFDLAYSDPFSLGHKLLAASLSDLAAMGAQPQYALASLMIPPKVDILFAAPFTSGMRSLAERFDVDLIGGNLSRARADLVLDLTLIGECKGAALLRSGVRPGDRVAVTGRLGESAAGLSCLRKLGAAAAAREFPNVVEAHLRPIPRVREGQKLRACGGVTSAIDVSDGLIKELYQLSRASAVGIVVDENRLWVSEELRTAAARCGADPHAWWWAGGEDYELLFTFPADKEAVVRATGVAFTVIGEADGRAGVVERNSARGCEPVCEQGWDHFRHA